MKNGKYGSVMKLMAREVNISETVQEYNASFQLKLKQNGIA